MKNIIKIALVLLLICGVSCNIFATGVFTDSDITDALNANSGSASLNAATRGVWSFIKTTIQVLAVGVIIFAGVRYMIASADQKADIKKSLGTLVIGAVIVFASTTVIEFIVKVVKDFTT